MSFRGALVKFRSTNPINVPDNYYGQYGYTFAEYDSVPEYDTDGFFDTVNCDKMIIPATLDGAWVIVNTSIRWNQLQGFWVQIFPTYFSAADGIEHYSDYPACDPDNRHTVLYTTTDHGSETHAMQVFEGDVFRTALYQSSQNGSGGTIQALAGSLSIRVIG